MATRIWRGNQQDGDINNAANYAGGVVPASTDTVLMDKDTSYPMLTNLATFAADTWALLYIGEDVDLPQFPYIIGDGSSGLDLNLITKFVNKSPTCGVTFQDGTITRAIIDSSKPKDRSSPAFKAINATVTNLVAVKGQITYDANTTGTNMFVSFRTSPFTDVDLWVDSSATPTSLFQRGGVVTLVRDTSIFIEIEGGLFDALSTSSGLVGLFHQHGGFVNFDADSTIGELSIFAGTFNTVNTTNELTITLLRRWPGAVFLKSDDLVTVTTERDMAGGDI